VVQLNEVWDSGKPRHKLLYLWHNKIHEFTFSTDVYIMLLTENITHFGYETYTASSGCAHSHKNVLTNQLRVAEPSFRSEQLLS
jgi:hypothetical protein